MWLEAWALAAAQQPAPPPGGLPPSPSGAHWAAAATAEMWLRLMEACARLATDRDAVVRGQHWFFPFFCMSCSRLIRCMLRCVAMCAGACARVAAGSADCSQCGSK